MKRVILLFIIFYSGLFAKDVMKFEIRFDKTAFLDVVDKDIIIRVDGVKSHLLGVVEFFDFPQNEYRKNILFEDYNFDGYKDLALLRSYGGSNVYRDIYIYNSKTKKYQKAFSDISNIIVDKENREVISTQKNSAIEYITNYYRVDEDNNLYLFLEDKRVGYSGFVTIYDKNHKIIKSFAKSKTISTIKEIKKEYINIVNTLNSLDKSKYELSQLSTEGGEVEIYKNIDKEIRFAHLMLFGEMYKIEYNFYFKNSMLFFVYSTKIEYNQPIYSEGFDLDKSTKKVNRYYFINEELERWLDDKGYNVDNNQEKFINAQKELLSLVRDFLKY